ncbi:MAG: hypothetical protein WBA57_05045 [Elainellaceae cyanobacterium]
MNDTLIFLGKIILASAAIAFLIKYGAPYLPLAANTTTVLIIVFLPTVVVAAAMAWRSLSSE